MEELNSLFKDLPDITPHKLKPNMSVVELVQFMGQTCFEARNVFKGAKLFKHMINEGDTIWLGIAGAGIAGGMGGIIISLLEAGFIDVICSTGAQIYHDLHFAFNLPVKAINPHCDDNALRKHGDTRIYDIGIREQETLEAQDKIIQKFVKDKYDVLSKKTLSSWEFNYYLGLWVYENAPYPELSLTAISAKLGVPIFWDSLANHSITMNLVRTDIEGFPVLLSPQKDIFDAASIVYSAKGTGFVELGGGGPKNFIQQTSPLIRQILSIDFDGADRGLQIGTAVERDGSLSSCTFGEAVTWGKYCSSDNTKLVQIWGEYSVIFPLLSAYVIDASEACGHKNIISQMPKFINKLKKA